MSSVLQQAEFTCAEARTLDSLNAIVVNAAQLKATMRVLADLPAAAASDPLTRGAALRWLAHTAGLAEDASVGAALHERAAALSDWIEAYDPHRQSDMETILEAAARFPLSDLPGGFGFDPAGFQEMVLFIEELPW